MNIGAWLITVVLDYLRNFFQALILSWANEKKQEAKEEQSANDSAAKYEEVINKPDVTREEQSASEDALLNRRH